MMNWMLTLFNRRTVNNILRLFGKKKSNSGMMWASLLGLVISIVAFGAKKNGSQTVDYTPLHNITEKMQNRSTANLLKAVTANEFSKELLPVKNPLSDE